MFLNVSIPFDLLYYFQYILNRNLVVYTSYQNKVILFNLKLIYAFVKDR